MPVVKCANCGATLIETFTRQGIKMLICPHVKVSTLKHRSGLLKHLSIYCSLDFQGLNASFQKLKGNANLTLEDLKEATNETVNDAKLLEQANLGLMLGLNPSDLANLFECAVKLGRAVGIDTTKAIESLCKGVGRRSRLILDNIGVAFQAKEAYEAFPDLDKNEAWQKYAIQQIKDKARVL